MVFVCNIREDRMFLEVQYAHRLNTDKAIT